MFEQKPILVGKISFLRGHGSCPTRATGSSQPHKHYGLAPVTGNSKGCKELMVPRVRLVPTWFLINLLYTQLDSPSLPSKPSMCYPWGQLLLLRHLTRKRFQTRELDNLYLRLRMIDNFVNISETVNSVRVWVLTTSWCGHFRLRERYECYSTQVRCGYIQSKRQLLLY